MPKINLLYVITKLELGGAQKQLLNLATHLDTSKYNIFLFTAKEGLLLADALAIKVIKIERSRFLERSLNPIKDLIALCEIYNYIRKNNIDIVHTHSSKAGILGRYAARLAKATIILHTVHGWGFNDYQPFWQRNLFIFLERIAAKFSDKLIVVSYCDRERGLNNRIGNKSKYILIRYGIEYAQFNLKDSGIKKELGFSSCDLVVGMVSCFKPQKSPQDFIKLAFLLVQRNPNVKFLLVGDGALRNKIENLIHQFGLEQRVILTGWRQDIPRILSAIDIFVLTSLWEGLPISVLEAMASAKLIVATNTGGIAEVILEGKTGFLVTPGKIEDMSEKLDWLLNNQGLSNEIGQNARNFLGREFKFRNTLSLTQNLYNDLWSMKRGAGYG